MKSLNMEAPREANETAIKWPLVLCGMVAALMMLPEVLVRPLFGDDAFYIWGAAQIRNGVYPIRDFFAIDPAGTWCFFTVVTSVFGESSIGYWIMVSCIVLGTGSLIGMAAHNLTTCVASGVWAGLLYVVFEFRVLPAFGVVGKDMLGLPFVLAGILIAARPRMRLVGHLILGVGLCIKPTLGAIWLVWMIIDMAENRSRWRRWLPYAGLSSILVGIPFLAVTMWAESSGGWGWDAFKVNVGLGGGSYGSYWSGPTVYKLIHVAASVIWLLPLVAVGCQCFQQTTLSQRKLVVALLAGGGINWVIQPMFNSWYFIPFLAGLFILAGAGLTRLIPRMQFQLISIVSLGLFCAFVPSTNLRWVKLFWDTSGNEIYTLTIHQSRIIAQSGVGNTPPDLQEWIHREVSNLVKDKARIGVLVTAGNLLWAIRDYLPGYWAVWCPSWNPHRLAEGIRSETADVIIGIEEAGDDDADLVYTERNSKLRWDMPSDVRVALRESYERVKVKDGYVIYRKRRGLASYPPH